MKVSKAKGVIVQKGTVTKTSEFTPTKNSGLSLRDANWISPTPRVIEVNESTTPNTNHYLVIPKSSPQLQSQIRIEFWDILAHTLTLSIADTKDLYVLDWLSNTDARRKAVENSPFPDLDSDQIALVFKNSRGGRIAGVKLRGLVLVKHTSDFKKEGVLKHDVVFKYDKCEKFSFPQEDKPMTPSGNEEADQEWSEIELKPQTKEEITTFSEFRDA